MKKEFYMCNSIFKAQRNRAWLNARLIVNTFLNCCNQYDISFQKKYTCIICFFFVTTFCPYFHEENPRGQVHALLIF